MKPLFFVVFVALPIIMLGGLKLIKLVYYFEKVTFPCQYNINKYIKKDGSQSKNILIINTAAKIGGAEIYSLNLGQNLLKDGYQVKYLITKNSELEQELQKLKISYYAYKKFSLFKTTIQPGFYSAINEMYKEEKIDIIHCNIHRETLAAKKAAKIHGSKVVLTCHIPQKINPKYIQDLDGFIGVNPEIANSTKKESLNVKVSEFIPPIFDEEKFINFSTNETKEEFFKNNFDIEVKKTPILCMVANMPTNINHKNHPILFKAIAKLIHEKNINLKIMLVGDGPLRNYLEQLAKELKIQDNIHFLGFTDKVADILYHSDIKILTSKKEGLPIVISEAALLKKPIIVGSNTPMTNIVSHEKTGLVFQYDNIDDLSEQIKRLIFDKNLQKKLGGNAYEHVLNNFSTKASMQKLEHFYEKVLKS